MSEHNATDIVQDAESFSEEPQSLEVEWRPWDGPCPNCGHEEFLEERHEENIVPLDENGDPIEFIPRAHAGVTARVMCRGCDEIIFEAED